MWVCFWVFCFVLLIWASVPSTNTAILITIASLVAQLGKSLPAIEGDRGSIPGLGRSPGEGRGYPLQYSWASLVAQLVKNPLAMWETWV